MGQKCKYVLTNGEITTFPEVNECLPVGYNGSRILYIKCPRDHAIDSEVFEFDLETRKFSFLGIFEDMEKVNRRLLLKTLDNYGFRNEDISCKTPVTDQN